MALTPLPIDPLLPDIVRCPGSLVLEAEPGAGKTTRVPRALLDAGRTGDIWILEPRRLAARLAALRVAEELGEEIGLTIGYAVRFEARVSPRTRIRFVTEAMLLRRMLSDPRLEGTSTVILDEFHERSIHTDLALALLKRLRAARPDLQILVMSATLDAAPVAAYLYAPRLSCEGRPHPVELRHLPRPDDRPLHLQVRDALDRVLVPGHVLVFLPGAAEIRACQRELEPLGRWAVRPLHGSLGLEAQRVALAPSDMPKVILSTNVAESSVTLDGVRTVIDSGLGREAFHSTWSGLASLRTRRISQARCTQRAGRAGRQGPGLCLRLYTEADHAMRPSFDEPEITRVDLADTLLALHALGVDPRELDWFEPPSSSRLEAAETLLGRLGALDAQGGITTQGRTMMDLPLHPRLARLVAAGRGLGIADQASLAAALLDGGELDARTSLDRAHPGSKGALDSDLWPRLDAFHEVQAAGFSAGACRAAGLDPGAVQRVRQAAQALGSRRGTEPPDAEARLRQALLLAFPDRVAKRTGGSTFTLGDGSGARLGPRSRVTRSDLVVALDASEVSRGAGRETLLEAVSAIEPEWLLEHFPDRIRETRELAFQPAKGRVELREGLWYDGLCLEEIRKRPDPSDPDAARLLAQAALEGPTLDGLDRLLDRVAFLARVRPELDLPCRASLREALALSACTSATGLDDLQAMDWSWSLRERIGPEASRLLDTWAPDAVQLPRRRVKVEYGEGEPFIASRLQDFLGLKEGPRIAGGTIPLVLHLLAPSQRPVQVTTDLAGFWQRTYRELRPSLSRRYPRHAWPEDPACE